MNVIAAMPADLRIETASDDSRPTCQHHWLIESPNGSVSRGVCKICKEEKLFNNSAERYLIKKKPVTRPHSTVRVPVVLFGEEESCLS